MGKRIARLAVDSVATVRVDGRGGEPGYSELRKVDVAADSPGLFSCGAEGHLHYVEVGRVVAVGTLRIESVAGLRVVQLDAERSIREGSLKA